MLEVIQRGREALHGAHGLRRQVGHVGGVSHRFPQAQAVPVRPRAYGRQRGGADLARGHVDDAQQRHGVVGVGDHTQVRQHVLDLTPLVEVHAADQQVGHALAHEGGFQGARLRVGAIHHGAATRRCLPARREAPDLGDDEAGLLLFVVGHLAPDEGALLVLRPQGLGLAQLVEHDDAVGGIEDSARGAVVLLQVDDHRIRVVVLELQNVANIGPAPTVDPLIAVPNYAQVAMLGGQQLDQQVLRVVGVLVLVDRDVAVAVGEVLTAVRVLLQVPHRLEDEVVEVERAVLLQPVLVLAVDTAHDLVEVACHLQAIRRHQIVLGLGDAGAHGPRAEGLLGDAGCCHGLFDEGQ